MANNEKFVDKLFGDELERVTISDRDGKEIEFVPLAIVDFEEKYYAVLQPATPVEGVEEDEVMFFYIDEENDCLTYVEDEELMANLFNEFIEMLEEMVGGE